MERALLAAAIALFISHTASADQTILNGSVAVPALGYMSYPVTVDRSSMNDPYIDGHIEASGGTGNDIGVWVLTGSDYLNWKNAHKTNPLYDSGHVTATDLHVPLPESGTYYVVLSNTFSAFTPKTVSGHLTLTWTVPASPSPSSNGAEQEFMWSSILMIVGILAIPGVIGGLIVWLVMSRRKKLQDALKAEIKSRPT